MRRFIEKIGMTRPGDWNERLFFVVVHLPEYRTATEAAWRETNLAMESGADGVVLISHGDLTTNELSAVWESLEERLFLGGIDFPVGVNWLTLRDPADMVQEAAVHGIPLVWSDAYKGELEVNSARFKTGWSGAYCGAFAFKVGPHVPNDEIPTVLEQAYSFMDIPITSGKGTGIAIDMEKARICRKAAGTRPLGIASGVSLENAGELLSLFNLFLVASSLSLHGDWYRQDPKKTAEMAKHFQAFQA